MSFVIFANCALIFFLIQLSVAWDWRVCKDQSVKGKVNSIVVSGCPASADICNLKKGTVANFTVNFNSDLVAVKVTAVVHGIIEHIPIPFPLDNPDACKDSGLQCPLAAKGTYTYGTGITVKTSYPNMRLIVRWELKNENGDDIFCIELPAAIVSGASNVLKFLPNSAPVRAIRL